MNWRLGICTLLYAFSASCGNVHLAVALPISDEAAADNIISLVGTGCEPFREGEVRSSVRVRAADKASFNAVEKIPELSEYRDSFSSHDFNVLVYSIIDNYIEDQTVRTASQDESRLCVEMTGYLNSENILKALNDNFQKFAVQPDEPAAAQPTVQYRNDSYPDSLQVENAASLQDPVSTLPPKPQLVINAKVSALEPLALPAPGSQSPADVADPAQAPQQSDSVQAAADPAQAPQQSAPVQAAAAPAQAAVVKVFLDKTRFYNNTSTLKFYQDLKQVVEERPGLKVTLDPELSAYTIKSKVLRAKVDPINQQTNRLQMVIAVELEQPGKDSVVEHQNRFILFDSKDDEQKVAANLMRKLLLQALRTVIKKIKLPQSEAIITPAVSNYGVFAPTPQP